MERIFDHIIRTLKQNGSANDHDVAAAIRAANRGLAPGQKPFAKRALSAGLRRIREEQPELYRSWDLTPEQERALEASLRLKPRRTSSGVATITVITKPHPCSAACLYCPSDVRMPKSYLADEPACQRAERNYFDPYLQVVSRLKALWANGHPTDKVELIILGGTWTEYPAWYQDWFMRGLFAALNDAGIAAGPGTDAAGAGQPGHVAANQPGHVSANQPGHASEAQGTLAEQRFDALHAAYQRVGVPFDEASILARTQELQTQVSAGETSYNKAVTSLYGASSSWMEGWRRVWTASLPENAGVPGGPGVPGGSGVPGDGGISGGLGVPGGASATNPGHFAFPDGKALPDLDALQHVNQSAKHRNVGLVVETRPDAISPEALQLMRSQGVTKVQIGVQSLDQGILDANNRHMRLEDIQHAFELLRLFGFKIHAHYMVNLFGATPTADLEGYRRLVADPRFQPDEVKLYPCALIGGTGLCSRFRAGTWQPYTEDQLVSLLSQAVLETPPFCRVSRMIRDFCAQDIVAGNRKANLRQMVEANLAPQAHQVQEIRFREIASDPFDPAQLQLHDEAYRTTVSQEHFLQWVTPEGRIAGFLRLSLPFEAEGGDEAPAATDMAAAGIGPRQAMIREVHVYGQAARIHSQADAQAASVGSSAQHSGLGTQLVEEACSLAKRAGYESINVISAVGTRGYYRKLGFADAGLYQNQPLM